MPDLTAKRTLVKSPPELWEELSEVERLAKHLGAFGDITITKLEPEHTVAWEGEHASGTVSIEPSGWGTKVTLRAELPEPSDPEPAADEREPAAAERPEPVAELPETEPVAERPESDAIAVLPEPEPVAERPEAEPVAERPQDDAVAELPEPEPEMEPETVEEAPPRGFWARLFGRGRPKPAREAAQEPEPVLEEPRPEAEPQEDEPEPEPVAEQPEPEPVAPEPEPAAEQPDADVPPAVDPERARVILAEALDTLGAAHHRPFSRG